MTKLEQARKLIAEATPGPWAILVDRKERALRLVSGTVLFPPTLIDAAALSSAVNQYAALLDVVEAAKGIHIKTDRDGKPVIIGMLALSEALAKWEES